MKLDITVNRNFHMNLGKDTFSSVDTNVTLTLKDVNSSDYDRKFRILSELTDATMAKEINKVLSECEVMYPNTSASLLKYNEGLSKAERNIDDTLIKFTKLLAEDK